MIGIDLAAEAAVTARLGCGKALSTHDGLVICHTEPTFTRPGVGFIQFLAAASRESFDRLLGAGACTYVRGALECVSDVADDSPVYADLCPYDDRLALPVAAPKPTDRKAALSARTRQLVGSRWKRAKRYF